MLAIRLHIKKNPKLNKGCYLIPIFNWDKDSVTLKDWVKTLEKCNQTRPNHKVNYITLVQIPDTFPIFLAGDWIEKMCISGDLPFLPLKDQKAVSQYIAQQSQCWMQELVLGKKLPKKYIKWTKNYRLWRKGK